MDGGYVPGWVRGRLCYQKKILGGRLEWRLPGEGSNSREHDFEAPLGTRGGAGRRGWESPGDRWAGRGREAKG